MFSKHCVQQSSIERHAIYKQELYFNTSKCSVIAVADKRATPNLVSVL